MGRCRVDVMLSLVQSTGKGRGMERPMRSTTRKEMGKWERVGWKRMKGKTRMEKLKKRTEHDKRSKETTPHLCLGLSFSVFSQELRWMLNWARWTRWTRRGCKRELRMASAGD